MKKIAYILRIITVPPLMALLLLYALYFNNLIDLKISIILFIFLSIVPSLSYLIEKKFNIYSKISKSDDVRLCQRNMAIIISLISYAIIFVYVLITKQNVVVKQLVSTYLISGIFIFLSTFVLKIKSSGHMCGFSGPIIFLTFKVSYWFSLFYILAFFIMWSSLKLKRHSLIDLLLGSIISITAFLISITIFI